MILKESFLIDKVVLYRGKESRYDIEGNNFAISVSAEIAQRLKIPIDTDLQNKIMTCVFESQSMALLEGKRWVNSDGMEDEDLRITNLSTTTSYEFQSLHMGVPTKLEVESKTEYILALKEWYQPMDSLCIIEWPLYSFQLKLLQSQFEQCARLGPLTYFKLTEMIFEENLEYNLLR